MERTANLRAEWSKNIVYTENFLPSYLTISLKQAIKKSINQFINNPTPVCWLIPAQSLQYQKRNWDENHEYILTEH